MKSILNLIYESLSVSSKKGQRKLSELVEEYWDSYWLKDADQDETKFLASISKILNGDFESNDELNNIPEFKKLKDFILSKKDFNEKELNIGILSETDRFIKQNCKYVHKNRVIKTLKI